MTQNTTAGPEIASRDEWLEQRKELLAHEKALTRQRDRVSAARRRLPMVQLDKDYLFDGCRQLIVHHFMFDPEWDKGCPGCTGYVDAMGMADLAVLGDRDTAFALVSRAPLAKLEAYKANKGWTSPGTRPTAVISTATSTSHSMRVSRPSSIITGV